MILDGSFVAKQIRKNVKIEVDQLRKRSLFPKLAVIQVGGDDASAIYLRNKKKLVRKQEFYLKNIILKGQ